MKATEKIWGTIPNYTKIGIRVTVVLMIVIMAVLLKNCVGSVYYGTITAKSDVEQYFRLGFREGVEQARSAGSATVLDHTNPLLVKSYQRGFREGWDSVRSTNEQKP